MFKIILVLLFAILDGSYTIDTHNYSFIRECFNNLGEVMATNREDITKNILDIFDLFI